MPPYLLFEHACVQVAVKRSEWFKLDDFLLGRHVKTFVNEVRYYMYCTLEVVDRGISITLHCSLDQAAVPRMLCLLVLMLLDCQVPRYRRPWKALVAICNIIVCCLLHQLLGHLLRLQWGTQRSIYKELARSSLQCKLYTF